MTSKTQKTSLLLSIAMLAVTVSLPSVVFADHSPYSSTLSNGEANYYYHCSSLNSLNVDGDTTNNCSEVQPEVNVARTNYNTAVSGLDLTTDSAYSSGDIIVYKDDLGWLGNSAEASYPDYVDDYLRFNEWRNFGTSGGCNSFFGITYAYNLEWLSNHEIGHNVGLLHPNPDPANYDTTMEHGCNSNWSSIQQHDIDRLDSLYP